MSPAPGAVTFPAPGPQIEQGDLVEIGGILHTVDEVHNRAAGRVRLYFTDGNLYTLEAFHRLNVTRPPAAPEPPSPSAVDPSRLPRPRHPAEGDGTQRKAPRQPLHRLPRQNATDPLRTENA